MDVGNEYLKITFSSLKMLGTLYSSSNDRHLYFDLELKGRRVLII